MSFFKKISLCFKTVKNLVKMNEELIEENFEKDKQIEIRY